MSDIPPVGQFFDCLSDDYTAVIERCFPRYREMLWALLDYLPRRPYASIVELGCGTGNLSLLLARAYPAARLRLVDLSAESLQLCSGRLGSDPRLAYEACDFRQLDLPPGEHDLVISSIAIHHVPADEKRALFGRIFKGLAPGGVFAYADQFAGATPELYQRHIANWRESTLRAGSTPEEWEMWMSHQTEHDYHDPLPDQLCWLAEAGFKSVDCPWRYLLWSVVLGTK